MGGGREGKREREIERERENVKEQGFNPAAHKQVVS